MKRVKDDKHLAFIRSLPCIICGDNTATEAAHIRFSDRRVAKRETGLGEKADDSWTVPLCNGHHQLQHRVNERAFWQGGRVDPILVALALYRVSGDHTAGGMICEAVHAS